MHGREVGTRARRLQRWTQSPVTASREWGVPGQQLPRAQEQRKPGSLVQQMIMDAHSVPHL